MRWIGVLFILVSLQATAQYSGRGVDTCLAYAVKDTGEKIVFDRDANLNIERYTKKAGNQFVSSLLLGNGAILRPGGTPIELSFICLLASDRQAVFFDWRPRSDAPALAQCGRGPDVGACLDALLQLAEQDLTGFYSTQFIEARQADAEAGNENAVTAFRKSADAFRAYRDAECARRGGGDASKACLVELTRRRAQDFR